MMKVKHPEKMNFSIRISKDLRDQLQKEAEADRRTLGAYIVLLLETHQDRQKKKP